MLVAEGNKTDRRTPLHRRAAGQAARARSPKTAAPANRFPKEAIAIDTKVAIWLLFVQKCGAFLFGLLTTVILFENARSLEAKLKLARQMGFRGISAWVAGQEDPGRHGSCTARGASLLPCQHGNPVE